MVATPLAKRRGWAVIIVLVHAAVGYVCGGLVHDGLLLAIHEHGWHAVVPTLLLLFPITLLVLDPLAERLTTLVDRTAREKPPNTTRSIARGVIALFILVAHFGVGAAIDANWMRSTVELLAAILIPGGVTYAWIRGARSGRRRATLLGAVVAFALDTTVGIGLIGATKVETLASPAGVAVALYYSAQFGLRAGLQGLAGGIAADLGGPHTARNIALAISLAAIAEVVGYIWLMGADSQTWRNLTQFVAASLGWATGLLLLPQQSVRATMPIEAAP